MIKDTDTAGLSAEIRNACLPVFAEFYAPRCGFCRAAAPMIEKMSESHTSVLFLRVNTDESRDAAEKFGVMGLPTYVLFDDGREVGRTVGARGEKPIEELIAKLPQKAFSVTTEPVD